VDASLRDSCVRLTPYCSLLIVKYDISCGEITFSDSVWVLRACWVAEGLPGSVGDSAKRFARDV
jgi:hypothetical protein